jgi:N-acetylated-alpha-linked acidic dipeptidase
VEHHKKELSEKMVAYINTDGTSRGFLNISGSHTLEKFVNEVRGEVDDPLVDASLQERLRARMMVSGSKYADREDLPIGALGAGSDYTAFLHHAGIASLNMGMGGEAGGGSYHSVYDSFDHYTRFMDPTFEYGVTLAKSTGRVTLRLADADVLPFRFTNFVDHVAQYAKELKEFAVEMREKTKHNNKLVDQNAYSLAAHPDKTYVLPKKLDSVPLFDFSPIDNALARLRASANRYEVALTNNIKKDVRPSGDEAQNLNQILMKSERAMMRQRVFPVGIGSST